MQGIGVNIQLLAGTHGDYKGALATALGKEITLAEVVDDKLRLGFADGTAIVIYDNGQSCCEDRYMKCDDDLQHFIGATLKGASIAEGPEINDGGDVHEQEFLIVETSKGTFTINNHNKHNGYYGGFSLTVESTSYYGVKHDPDFKECIMSWQTMDTYEQGDYVLFFFPKGERGNGAIVSAMAFKYEDDGDWDFWSYGGPNSGYDFEPCLNNEQPTHWAPLPDFPTLS